MTDSQTGSFSFRIPREQLFNFYENYTKVIFNCKHELQLNRQTDDNTIFKSVFWQLKAEFNRIECDGTCLKLRWMSSTKQKYINILILELSRFGFYE